jgi:hypothetical protein
VGAIHAGAQDAVRALFVGNHVSLPAPESADT